VYHLERNFADAAKYFQFALEYCDSTASGHYLRWQDLGEALYWVEGRRPEAERAFRRAIALAEEQLDKTPGDAKILAYAAGCYARIGDRSRAQSLVERAVAVGSEDPQTMVTIGNTFEQLGDRERALHYIARAVRLDYPLSWIEADPSFEDLTKDIRFRQLVDATAREAAEGKAKAQ